MSQASHRTCIAFTPLSQLVEARCLLVQLLLEFCSIFDKPILIARHGRQYKIRYQLLPLLRVQGLPEQRSAAFLL